MNILISPPTKDIMFKLLPAEEQTRMLRELDGFLPIMSVFNRTQCNLSNRWSALESSRRALAEKLDNYAIMELGIGAFHDPITAAADAAAHHRRSRIRTIDRLGKESYQDLCKLLAQYDAGEAAVDDVQNRIYHEWLSSYHSYCPDFPSDTTERLAHMGAIVYVDYSIDTDGYCPNKYYLSGYEPDEVDPTTGAVEKLPGDDGYLRDYHDYTCRALPGTDHSTATYGVELELYHDDRRNEIGAAIRHLDGVRACKDGSLDDYRGAEVVTDYGNLDPLRAHLAKVVSALKDNNVYAPRDTDYGLHVHRSHEDLGIRGLVRLFNLMNDLIDSSFLSKIAGRCTTSYAARMDESDIRHVLRYGKPSERYKVINATDRTVEFRMFHTTMNDERLAYRLEFVKASCEFVKVRGVGLKPRTNDFIDWVFKRKEDYPALMTFINTNWHTAKEFYAKRRAA
jgi:hypothetical protein